MSRFHADLLRRLCELFVQVFARRHGDLTGLGWAERRAVCAGVDKKPATPLSLLPRSASDWACDLVNYIRSYLWLADVECVGYRRGESRLIDYGCISTGTI